MVGINDVWASPQSSSDVRKPRGRRPVPGKSFVHTTMIAPAPPPPRNDADFLKNIGAPQRQYASRHHHSIVDRDSNTTNVCWSALFPTRKFQKQTADVSCTAFADSALRAHREPFSYRNIKPRVIPEYVPRAFVPPVDHDPVVLTPRSIGAGSRHPSPTSNTVSPTSSPRHSAVPPLKIPAAAKLSDTMRSNDTAHSARSGFYSRRPLQWDPSSTINSVRTRQLTAKLPTFDHIASTYAKAKGEDANDSELINSRQREFDEEMISKDAAMRAIGSFERNQGFWTSRSPRRNV